MTGTELDDAAVVDDPAFARLTDIANDALLGADVHSVLQNIGELLRDALDTELVGAFTLIPDAGLLHLVAGVGWRDGLIGHASTTARGQALGELCLASPQPLVIDDLTTDQRFEDAALLLDHAVTSGIAAVIHGRGRPYGVIWAFTARKRSFSGLEVAFVDLAARVAAAAVRARGREAELLRRGLRDVLTGLPNWVVFIDRLDQALARSQRHGGAVAVLYIDVDGFGELNQRLGADVADRLLQEMAGRICDALRSDDTVARFDSDAFAVLCEYVRGPAEAVRIGERIKQALAAQPLCGAEPMPTVSIGVTMPPGPATPPEVLLNHARAAMAAARASGGGEVRLFDERSRSGLRAARAVSA